MASQAPSAGAAVESGETPRLFTPMRIGPVLIKNRVIMAPMTTRYADRDGYVTDDVVNYYVARAAGDVGLITVEMASPEKVGRHRKFELGLYDDRFLPGLRRLVQAIQGRGSRLAIQLGHAGGHTRADVAGETPIAPSAIPHIVQEGDTQTVVPREMSTDRIRQTMQAFVDAARRAKAAGFDIVEIHAAHGYLISQFLTPAENVRTDEFGGSLENRARFGLEVVRAIKTQVPELGLIFRLNGSDFFPGGLTSEDAEQVAIWSAAAGADAIHVTGGHYRSEPTAAVMIPPMSMPEATFLAFAARIKQRVPVPVIAVGRLGDPQLALRAVEEGDVDFVALGRPMLADAQWPAKVRAGKPVRRCIACNTCVDGMRQGHRLHCLVNPATGRESRLANNDSEQVPRLSGKRIAVIGAGPAGLNFAALTAAHNDVTVFERGPRPGGAFLLAGSAPKFQGVQADQSVLIRYIDDLEAQCRLSGAKFVYDHQVGPDSEILKGYDLVVMANGAVYRWGLGRIATGLLKRGAFRLPGLRRLAEIEGIRNWFYHRARRAAGEKLARQFGPDTEVAVIGDAKSPGKSDAAILSAFEAALGPLNAGG